MGDISLGIGGNWSLDEDGDLTIETRFPAIVPEAPRLRHTYMMAGTGSGKSELMKLLIHHEMTQQRAVIVIDAHSDLCEQIARWPEFLGNDRVVYISPHIDVKRTAVFNPFEIPKGLPISVKDLIAETLGAATAEVCSGIGAEVMSFRMETVITTAVRVVLELKNPSFIELRRALADDTPADIMKIGSSHWSSEVRDIFHSEWNSTDYRAAKASVRGRLRRLLSMYAFRNMTCGKSTVPFYELAENGGVMLFSLGGAGTRAAKSLGKLVVCMSTIVGLLRFSIPEEQRKQLHLFMDECQNFVGTSTVTVLEELRKFRVLLTMANQNIERLPEIVQQGILSNAGVNIMGDGSMPTAMLKRLRTPLEMAQKLEERKFLVRWGSKPTFMLYPRTDLAKRHEIISKLDWLELKASQRQKYYVPIVDEPIPDDGGELDGWQDVAEVNLDLD